MGSNRSEHFRGGVNEVDRELLGRFLLLESLREMGSQTSRRAGLPPPRRGVEKQFVLASRRRLRNPGKE
ncbi:hypothetical protein BHM03_00043711 [Ensete ventricosum]|nr:hypothetical protein BHM03_00043711 [Ensete ventricosum]